MTLRFPLCIVLFALLAEPAMAGESAASRWILRDAAVYTLDASHPWAKALVIDNGRIVYVGDEDGAAAYARDDAHNVDLHGRMILPAFHDSHTHPMSSGMRLLRCQFDGIASASKLYAAVRACAANAPDKPWLLGSGLAPALLKHRILDRRRLDTLVPDRPAFLTSDDGYTAWVNSKALAIAGIDASNPGVLEGDTANLVRKHVPPPTEADYREALRLTMAMANRFGVASIVDASASAAMLDAYHAADVAGELTVRVVAAQRIDPQQGEAQVGDFVERRDRTRGRLFRADAAKIFLDGEFEWRTAALLDSYAGSADEHGPPIDAGALDASVQRLDAAGFLIHMHAMGDRAVRLGLDAIEHAVHANGARDRRHQLAHIGIASTEDIARFGTLGVAANFQPQWFQVDDAALAPSEKALGAERARRMYPIASVAAKGARILASSDWPSTSMNPLDAIQVAMTRQPLNRAAPAFEPEQRMSLAAMLAAYTRDAAWIAREDTETGTLEIGKAADLIVLDRNLFEVPVAHLHEARVLLTMLEGRPVYRDSAFAWP